MNLRKHVLKLLNERKHAEEGQAKQHTSKDKRKPAGSFLDILHNAKHLDGRPLTQVEAVSQAHALPQFN